MNSLSITGFHSWIDFLKALVFLCGGIYTTMVFALDSRYATNDAVQQVVVDLRIDRIDSDIRSIKRRIAVVEVQAQSSDDPTALWRRQQELVLLKSDLDDLEGERERLE